LRAPFILLLSAVIAATPAFAAERNFPVGGFTKIRLTGSPDVVVKTGPQPSVRATGAEADLERLEIVVRGSELQISQISGVWNWDRGGIRIAVTVPQLEAASLVGSGDMEIDRIKGGAFSGDLRGSGDLALGAIDAGAVSLAIEGSGDISAAGRCDSGTFAVNGSGDIGAAGLRCRTATVTLQGSGDIAVGATATATVALNGSGNVSVTGGARCTTSKRGSGDVSCS
jgi:hypothetical protein